MLGFGDFWVAAAYLLCIGSTLLCVVYGLLRWNQDEAMPLPPEPTEDDRDLEEI